MIVDLLLLTLLTLEVVVLSRLDRRRFGTWVTPFTLLGYPYTAVAILAYFFAPIFDFVPLYSGSVVLWILGLLMVWGAGNFLGWGLLDLRLAPALQPAHSQVGTERTNEDAIALRWAVSLAWVSMPFMLYGAIATARTAEIGTTEFRDAYVHGLPAHAVVLATLLTIVLIGLYRRGDKRLFVTITILFVFLVLGQVKGTVLTGLIGGFLFRMIRGQFRFTFKKAAVLLLSTYIIFNVVYLVSTAAYSSGDLLQGEIYSHLARHYLYYLFAGVLALSEAMRSGITDVGGGWPTIFGPFLNLYHAILGGAMVPAGSTHDKGMDTDLLVKASGEANVYTFFGTLHLYLGVFGAILYIFIVALLCYGFLVLVKRKNNAWLTASYCLIAAQLSLGFFELYFWYLTAYEIIAMGVVLSFLSRSNYWSRWHQGRTISHSY